MMQPVGRVRHSCPAAEWLQGECYLLQGNADVTLGSRYMLEA